MANTTKCECGNETTRCDECRAALCRTCDYVQAVYLDSTQPEPDHFICEACAHGGLVAVELIAVPGVSA